MQQRLPCIRCGAMVLPSTTEQTSGLCMPCFNRDKAQAATERAKTERMQAEREAITLPDSPDEEAFLQNCAVYCELDCCGFNALDLSDSQIRTTVESIGLVSAKCALEAIRSQGQRIGGHIGLVRFRGFLEPAQETRRKCEDAIAVLERVIKEVEQVVDGKPPEAPQPPR